MLGWHRRQPWAEGVAQGRATTRLEMVREILRARGIAISDQGFAVVSEIDVTSNDAVARAALGCNDEANFLARLGRCR